MNKTFRKLVIGDVTHVHGHGLAGTLKGHYLVAGSMWEAPKGQGTEPPKPQGMSEA